MPRLCPEIGLDELLYRQLRSMHANLRMGHCLQPSAADAMMRAAVARLFADIAMEVSGGPNAEVARMINALGDAVEQRTGNRKAVAR